MKVFKNTRAILCDLDGVLYVGDRLIEGAVEAISSLKTLGYPIRFTTNTTTKSIEALHQKLADLGLPIEPDEVFGVVKAAQMHLRRIGNPTVHLLLTDGPAQDFAEFDISDDKPGAIIIGDIGKDWDSALLNKVFRMVMDGAEIVALHKGRYWETEDGLKVDIGAFVAGLEYSTGKMATVIGKPARTFFRLAVSDLGVTPYETLMVGDDLFGDVEGAQKSGMTGVLVKTGKYREEVVRESKITPDATIDSIADLSTLLGG